MYNIYRLYTSYNYDIKFVLKNHEVYLSHTSRHLPSFLVFVIFYYLTWAN